MKRILVVAATAGEVAGLEDVETLVCGVGPVEAAAAVAARIAAGPPVDAILHVGIAGARRTSGLAPRTVVIGEQSIYCDTVSRFVPREVEPDAGLVAVLVAALPDVHVRTIGTSADVGGSADCDVEAMEGFGVLRAARLAFVPAVELRVVSNEVEEVDRAKWDFAGALAVLAGATRTAINALRGFDA